MIVKGFKKLLVFGMFVLFVGVVVAPIISGFDRITVVQSVRDSPVVFPLDENDYINGFWKFDEGSGSTAGDSSGHGYDGDIYDAKWVAGKVGDALEFDGVNDYISLDSYAKNFLGFNKTDDLIISFYFKSSSNDKGVIFSTCRGDDYGYNPGSHIALCANGTIEVQVWRLSCGLIMWSNESYNDGLWHFVKVYYNGITSNPIVYIYVDGDLDKYYEKYICDFHSDNFKYAQLGRNSDEKIDYFDGVLDELKYVKYPGGNGQKPPVIDGPHYGKSDVNYEYTFTTYDPEEDDDLYILIDWDDGTEEYWRGPFDSGEVVPVSHEWDEDGVYNVTARSMDFWHMSRWSDDYTVYIGNQPPSSPVIDGPVEGDLDVEYKFTFRSDDIEEDEVKYVVDWDDGDETVTGYYPSGQTVELSHAWDERGDYVINAQAVDEYGAASGKSEYGIRIGNLPPGKPYIDGPVSGRPNFEIDFEFRVIDPENDQVWFDIDWGDGNVLSDVGPKVSGEKFKVSHVWAVMGDYIVKARARDDYGDYGEWESFDIVIPRFRGFSCDFFVLLFERFPYIFHLTRYILGL